MCACMSLLCVGASCICREGNDEAEEPVADAISRATLHRLSVAMPLASAQPVPTPHGSTVRSGPSK